MKGLILKDLYILKGYSKQYGIILLFMALWSYITKNTSFMTVYFVVISGNVVMSSVSTDEASSFQRFALTAPVSRRALVGSKYVLLLITMSGGYLLARLMDLLMRFSPNKNQVWFDMDGMIVSVCLFVLANAISLPAIFKLGVEKARYIYIVGMLAIAAAIFGAANFLEETGTSMDARIAAISPVVLNGFFVIVAAFFLVISYLVSVRLVAKKDF